MEEAYGKEKQDAAIEKYSRILDKWIDGFQEVPEQIRNEDGSILMKLNCVVPADEVRKEIAELVVTAAAIAAAVALILIARARQKKD